MDIKINLILLSTWLLIAIGQKYYPKKAPISVIDYSDPTRANGELSMFRSVLIDETGQYAYVGAKSSVYKIRLATYVDADNSKKALPSIKNSKPNFNDK